MKEFDSQFLEIINILKSQVNSTAFGIYNSLMEKESMKEDKECAEFSNIND
ncbi:unnamed protein product [Paramecium octaurelia]|uniref:Uncharacterized protein n=1 Tax=Paramecium octaurelia TaxID=43137 RepID=A0A8S1SPY6_PAROT|nr:unnamed protein product [Paramecium octaurelia]